MSELKVYHCNEWHNEYTEFYLKDKADAVIAELKKKLVEQATLRLWAELQLRHNKYKRCLAVVEMLEHICPITIRKAKWKGRWHMRWLELAKKFKDGK